MNKNALVGKAVELLHSCDARKKVPAQKTVLHITDDNGNKKDFIIRKSERGYLYTAEDVNAILEALLAVTEDAIKHGEVVSIHGFGSLELCYKQATTAKHPKTGENITIDAHYMPKFFPKKNLQMAAKVYSLTNINQETPIPFDKEGE